MRALIVEDDRKLALKLARAAAQRSECLGYLQQSRSLQSDPDSGFLGPQSNTERETFRNVSD
jgi:hypothetical protein